MLSRGTRLLKNYESFATATLNLRPSTHHTHLGMGPTKSLDLICVAHAVVMMMTLP